MPFLDDLEVFELTLGNDFLMTSLFHEVEEALADLSLPKVAAASPRVVVGGLGLGFTAAAVLRNPQVRELVVVEFLGGVIEWHCEGVIPLGVDLASDARCRFVEADFFALAADPETGFDPDRAGRRFDAVLLDIDHSPRKLLHERHADFYRPEGLRRLAAQLAAGGVFALWSDDPPDEGFLGDLRTVFPDAEAHVVRFFNPILERDSSSTVYVAPKTG